MLLLAGKNNVLTDIFMRFLPMKPQKTKDVPFGPCSEVTLEASGLQ